MRSGNGGHRCEVKKPEADLLSLGGRSVGPHRFLTNRSQYFNTQTRNGRESTVLSTGEVARRREMLAALACSALAFAPPLTGMSGRPTARPQRSPAVMVDSPMEALASPLRKFEGTSTAAAGTGDILKDVPIEVVGLFGAIILVGVAGLVKQSGVLSAAAPTVGLGDSRADLKESAETAATEEADMTQAEQEKKYFAILAEEAKGKRGGSSEARKKKSKKR
eukprot:2480734-Prymnesium_polylepis.2